MRPEVGEHVTTLLEPSRPDQTAGGEKHLSSVMYIVLTVPDTQPILQEKQQSSFSALLKKAQLLWPGSNTQDLVH